MKDNGQNIESQAKYFKQSQDFIIEARMAITYSYVLGYYLNDEPKRDFLVWSLGELLKAVETLDNLTNLTYKDYR